MTGTDLGRQAAERWDGPTSPLPHLTRGSIAYLSGGRDVPSSLVAAARTIDVGLAVMPFAADAGDRLPTGVDALWLPTADHSDAGIAAVAAHVDQWQQALVLDCAVADLDRVWGAYGDRDGITILADPDVQDCLLTLSRLVKSTGSTLHSPIAEAREREIEQLQEDVQRISRMLARLSQDSADTAYRPADGSREPASPFIETDYVDPALRSPARGYDAGTAAEMTGKPPVTARAVRQMIRRRRLREEYFTPELFADPAWDMLLDLYAARLERHRVSVSSLCIAAAVPATTALRWIKTLTDAGMFSRDADQHDGRRIFVSLTDAAAVALHRYFARLNEE